MTRGGGLLQISVHSHPGKGGWKGMVDLITNFLRDRLCVMVVLMLLKAVGSNVSLWLVWTPWHGGCLLISDHSLCSGGKKFSLCSGDKRFRFVTAMNLAKETAWSSQRGSYY